MTKLKTLAVAGMTMGLALGAQAEKTAKAVLTGTSNNRTLTFYYDEATHEGTTYNIPKACGVASNVPWYEDRNKIINVVFDKSFAEYRPTATAFWFNYFTSGSLKFMNLENLNTSEVTTMQKMFYGCEHVKTLDVSSFDTAKVKYMQGMFGDCGSGAKSFTLNLGNMNTAKVSNMDSMFSGCTTITTLDLSSFKTYSGKDSTVLASMFAGCEKLKTIYVSKSFTNGMAQSSQMFKDCKALVGGNGTKYDANHTDAEYARIDNPPDAPGYFTGPPDYLTFTAEEDGSTVTFNWSKANWVSNSTDGVTWNEYTKGAKITLTNTGDKVMFKGSGVTTGFDENYAVQCFSMTGKIAASGDVGTLTDGKGGEGVTLTEKCYAYMFYSCTALTTTPALPATQLATSCYASMFSSCTSLTAAPALPAKNLVAYCYEGMFSGCSSLKVNQEEPGTAWSIPAETEANRWNNNMFARNKGTVPYWPSKGVTYYVVPTVAFTPEEVENATWEIIEDNGVWPLKDKVHTNGTIKVRYTAKDGLAFADGSYVKTVYVGKADADPFAPTGYAPAAPQEWTQDTASTTVDIDTRTDKTYFDADDILPIWADKRADVTTTNTSAAVESKTIVSTSSTTNWYGWKPAYLGKYTLTKSGMDWTTRQEITETADITYTTPVYVSTNAALDVEGTTWALTDAGGSPITEMDDQGRFKVPTNSQLKVVYTVAKGEGYYFKDGKTTYEAAFTATGAEELDAATMIGDNKPKAGDVGQPKLKLGVVAQRYPWDGKIDVQYWAQNTPNEGYEITITVTLPDGKTASETKPCLNGKNVTDFDAREKFGEVKFSKGVKVRATLIP